MRHFILGALALVLLAGRAAPSLCDPRAGAPGSLRQDRFFVKQPIAELDTALAVGDVVPIGWLVEQQEYSIRLQALGAVISQLLEPAAAVRQARIHINYRLNMLLHQ